MAIYKESFCSSTGFRGT